MPINKLITDLPTGTDVLITWDDWAPGDVEGAVVIEHTGDAIAFRYHNSDACTVVMTDAITEIGGVLKLYSAGRITAWGM